ncbi:MAG: mechanosensitive ion channel family protein [Myxococcales bacterium]|nr:mechanosensitive ion channel family protein [Myxococcales bacterium]MCB9737103.1 mechanosensitive ion channel family protein [Deltaproteobacteria bacterium]
MDWLDDWHLLGQPLSRWAVALGVTLVSLAVLVFFKKLVTGRFAKLASRTKTNLDDIVVGTLESTRLWFYVVAALFIGSIPLALSPEANQVLRRVAALCLLFQIGLWARTALRLGVAGWRERHADTADAAAAAAGVAFVGQLVVWSIVFVLALSNLGIEISALVAGLGIGGIAAALAVQNVLGDLFASLSIYFDRPFDLGDFIIVDDLMGSVSKIGMRSTQVRSLGGEQLVFANSDLAKSRIKNYKRMAERRIVFKVGVTYETPYALVERVPAMLREAVEGAGDVRFDRGHFQSFGDFSLVFEVVYYVLSPDYNAYMDVQQRINLTIMKRFQDEGIVFAYPTKMLHFEPTELRDALVERPGPDTADRGGMPRGRTPQR